MLQVFLFGHEHFADLEHVRHRVENNPNVGEQSEHPQALCVLVKIVATTLRVVAKHAAEANNKGGVSDQHKSTSQQSKGIPRHVKRSQDLKNSSETDQVRQSRRLTGARK